MKLFKSLLIVLLILVNFILAPPALADKPKYLKNPDYIEVSKALDELVAAKDARVKTGGSVPAEIQRKIDELEFQKYALETGVNWGQCRNQTGKTLAVYGPIPNFDDDEEDYAYDTGLYFLAPGQATKNKWDCEGVYLSSDATTAVTSPDGKTQDLTGPAVIKIADGTQLTISTNPNTGAVEFNLPPTKVFQADEINWFIPNVAQAFIDARVPNAPAYQIADSPNLIAKKTAAPAAQAKAKPESEPEPEIKLQTLPRKGYYSK
ncbi:MAG: hypothetical protein CLLPBCKN_005992 [Chroococcidiopsis cubana SAG 39.79]|uniref:Uncharacterized protein n=1 Tax=Chroococcidiopsis cubana SAG 39.79 TaxID=388085 RepID=A0AB37UGA2_9CYAN|nr:hypothetical protein [Chroococcidiopsis cubana]MDZ4876557.1 hypothetical protein [Chroococcidiopsis cubana SAG 39.79]RUT10380.1 hypothetical protein DSM107010_43760 [Chroococcidiopsis cubana SAG 39.79]